MVVSIISSGGDTCCRHIKGALSTFLGLVLAHDIALRLLETVSGLRLTTILKRGLFGVADDPSVLV